MKFYHLPLCCRSETTASFPAASAAGSAACLSNNNRPTVHRIILLMMVPGFYCNTAYCLNHWLFYFSWLSAQLSQQHQKCDKGKLVGFLFVEFPQIVSNEEKFSLKGKLYFILYASRHQKNEISGLETKTKQTKTAAPCQDAEIHLPGKQACDLCCAKEEGSPAGGPADVAAATVNLLDVQSVTSSSTTTDDAKTNATSKRSKNWAKSPKYLLPPILSQIFQLIKFNIVFSEDTKTLIVAANFY